MNRVCQWLVRSARYSCERSFIVLSFGYSFQENKVVLVIRFGSKKLVTDDAQITNMMWNFIEPWLMY